MATPSIAEALRRLAARTAGGVRKVRIVQTSESGVLVQDGRDATLAGTTTDEVLHAGDAVWAQPAQTDGRLVIHGKA